LAAVGDDTVVILINQPFNTINVQKTIIYGLGLGRLIDVIYCGQEDSHHGKHVRFTEKVNDVVD